MEPLIGNSSGLYESDDELGNSIQKSNSILNFKQNSLNDILKQGSVHFLAENFQKAVPLYEYALTLVNEDSASEEYELYEEDVCAIEYALCMCYITQTNYFEKAAEELAPLVISYGKQFPTLFLAQAKLFLQQHMFDKTKQCIEGGLAALEHHTLEGSIFKRNWPGTNVEIPESNLDVLRKELKSLGKQCDLQQSEYATEKGIGKRARNSKPSLSLNKNKVKRKQEPHYDQPENKTDPTNLIVTEISTLNDSQQLQDAILPTILDTIKNENRSGSNCTNGMECFNSIHLKSTLKADVPPFVPKSTILGVYNEKLHKDVSSSTDVIEVVHQLSQTKTIDKVEKYILVKPTTANVSLQTLKVEKGPKTVNVCLQTKAEKEPCQKCMSLEKDIANNSKTLENDTKTLQKKIKHLKEELNSSTKRLQQEQQLRNTLEQKSNINCVKLEVQLEVISDKCKLVEEKLEEEVNKNKMLTSMLMVQFMKNSNIQKVLLNKHVEKCKLVLANLKSTTVYLTSKTIPTLGVCQKHIDLWLAELVKTQCCITDFQEYQDIVLSKFHDGNFKDLPTSPLFSLITDEPRNILQESFHFAVARLFGQLQDCRSVLQKYHEEYYTWWDTQGKFMFPQDNPSVPISPWPQQQHFGNTQDCPLIPIPLQLQQHSPHRVFQNLGNNVAIMPNGIQNGLKTNPNVPKCTVQSNTTIPIVDHNTLMTQFKNTDTVLEPVGTPDAEPNLIKTSSTDITETPESPLEMPKIIEIQPNMEVPNIIENVGSRSITNVEATEAIKSSKETIIVPVPTETVTKAEPNLETPVLVEKVDNTVEQPKSNKVETCRMIEPVNNTQLNLEMSTITEILNMPQLYAKVRTVDDSRTSNVEMSSVTEVIKSSTCSVATPLLPETIKNGQPNIENSRLNDSIPIVPLNEEIPIIVGNLNNNVFNDVQRLQAGNMEPPTSSFNDFDTECNMENDKLISNSIRCKLSPIKLHHKKLVNNQHVVSQLTDDIVEHPNSTEEACNIPVKRNIRRRVYELAPRSQSPTKVQHDEVNFKEEYKHLYQCNQATSQSTLDKSGHMPRRKPTQNDHTINTKAIAIETQPNTLVINNELVNLNQLLKREETAMGSVKALGGPKFRMLFCYVKSKIPNVSDNILLAALFSVKQKRVKLSGLSRETIVAAVQQELIGSMEVQSSNPPTPKAAWTKINNEPLKWNNEQNDTDTSCVICIEPFEGVSVTRLKCEHKFHTDCIKKWFSTNCICPVCRLHATIDDDFPPLKS